MPRQVWFKTAYVDVNTGTVTRELEICCQNVLPPWTKGDALPAACVRTPAR